MYYDNKTSARDNDLVTNIAKLQAGRAGILGAGLDNLQKNVKSYGQDKYKREHADAFNSNDPLALMSLDTSKMSPEDQKAYAIKLGNAKYLQQKKQQDLLFKQQQQDRVDKKNTQAAQQYYLDQVASGKNYVDFNSLISKDDINASSYTDRDQDILAGTIDPSKPGVRVLPKIDTDVLLDPVKGKALEKDLLAKGVNASDLEGLKLRAKRQYAISDAAGAMTNKETEVEQSGRILQDMRDKGMHIPISVLKDYADKKANAFKAKKTAIDGATATLNSVSKEANNLGLNLAKVLDKVAAEKKAYYSKGKNKELKLPFKGTYKEIKDQLRQKVSPGLVRFFGAGDSGDIDSYFKEKGKTAGWSFNKSAWVANQMIDNHWYDTNVYGANDKAANEEINKLAADYDRRVKASGAKAKGYSGSETIKNLTKRQQELVAKAQTARDTIAKASMTPLQRRQAYVEGILPTSAGLYEPDSSKQKDAQQNGGHGKQSDMNTSTKTNDTTISNIDYLLNKHMSDVASGKAATGIKSKYDLAKILPGEKATSKNNGITTDSILNKVNKMPMAQVEAESTVMDTLGIDPTNATPNEILRAFEAYRKTTPNGIIVDPDMLKAAEYYDKKYTINKDVKASKLSGIEKVPVTERDAVQLVQGLFGYTPTRKIPKARTLLPDSFDATQQEPGLSDTSLTFIPISKLGEGLLKASSPLLKAVGSKLLKPAKSLKDYIATKKMIEEALKHTKTANDVIKLKEAHRALMEEMRRGNFYN